MPDIPSLVTTVKITVVIAGIALLLIIYNHNISFQKAGTIVLPAGGTYLGPSTTDAPSENPNPEEKANITSGNKFTVTTDTPWITVKGRIYPYSFSAPKTLTLTTFANDQYDMYAISWNNLPPDQNVLIGVDNLERSDALRQYIKRPKRSYIQNWWKQFNGLTGVASITEFSNKNGLKGYKTKFLNSGGPVANDDIFFEVMSPKYVIHLSNGALDPIIFDAIVDSVSWGKLY